MTRLAPDESQNTAYKDSLNDKYLQWIYVFANAQGGRIHFGVNDAHEANLIPAEVTREQAAMKYADEADVLNIAMFGMTAKQWRDANPDKKGNILLKVTSINSALKKFFWLNPRNATNRQEFLTVEFCLFLIET